MMGKNVSCQSRRAVGDILKRSCGGRRLRLFSGGPEEGVLQQHAQEDEHDHCPRAGSGRRGQIVFVLRAIQVQHPQPAQQEERCAGCGDCVLGRTGGVCPVARCSKRIFNGPCGGSTKGKCEIDPNVDCAWQLIWDRLKALGRTDLYSEIIPAKDWRSAKDGGPRRIVREDLLS